MENLLLDEQQKLLQKWHFSGHVDHQSFVDLAEVSNVTQLDLAQDNLLLLTICTVAFGLQKNLPQMLTQLISSKIVWYPNYFSDDLVCLGECSKFLFHPAIAVKYFLVRQQIAQIDLYNRDPNQQIFCTIVKYHHLLRHSSFISLFSLSNLGQYFIQHQVLLYDTHHLRWLHLIADDSSYNLLLCLETGTVGVERKLYAQEEELTAAEVNLQELADLPLFRDRLYVPLFAAKLICVQHPHLAQGLSQIYRFWIDRCQPKFSVRRSAKSCVLEVLQEHNYISPFGVQN